MPNFKHVSSSTDVNGSAPLLEVLILLPYFPYVLSRSLSFYRYLLSTRFLLFQCSSPPVILFANSISGASLLVVLEIVICD